MKYVIIGNGIAGVNAAEVIRKTDPGGEIVMIADEASPDRQANGAAVDLEGRVVNQVLPFPNGVPLFLACGARVGIFHGAPLFRLGNRLLFRFNLDSDYIRLPNFLPRNTPRFRGK